MCDREASFTILDLGGVAQSVHCEGGARLLF